MQVVKNWQAEGVPVDDQRWLLIQRIVSSGHFVKAPQLREFLLYAAGRYLANRAGEISEHQIGCSVLSRREDFNPSQDNIVRVQARHLRKKLDDYFAGEGRDESMIVCIPKGSYVPRFEKRSPQPEPPDLPGAFEHTPRNGNAAALSRSEPPSKNHAKLALYAILPLTLILGVVAWIQGQSPARLADVSRGETEFGRKDPLFSRLFAPAQRTQIVIADTCLVMLQDLLNTDISIGDYVSPEYPSKFLRQVSDPQLRGALNMITARQYTSLADANIASRLLQVGHRYTPETAIRYARHVNIRDFKTDNFILIGSRRGIPWVELFEGRMNFQARWDRDRESFFFHNKSPLPGEQSDYSMVDRGDSRELFAEIALLPNLSDSGFVLMLNGITMEASEAAGELITGREFRSELEKLRVKAGAASTPYFEVLIKTNAVGGAARDTKPIAYRPIARGFSGKTSETEAAPRGR